MSKQDPKGEGNREADKKYRKAVQETVDNTTEKERAEKACNVDPEKLKEGRKAEETGKKKAKS